VIANVTDRQNGRRLPLSEIDPMEIMMEFRFDCCLRLLEFHFRFLKLQDQTKAVSAIITAFRPPPP
jgi:hypothetical protein